MTFFQIFLKKKISFSRLEFIKYSKLVTDKNYKPQLMMHRKCTVTMVQCKHKRVLKKSQSLNVLATDKIKISKI